MFGPRISYEKLELLGEGGQGRVFKALRRDRKSGLCEIVALKILHSKTAVELWRREFESLRKVRSPHCVQALAFDRVDGRPALALEYVEGVSLIELTRRQDLSRCEVAEIVAQTETALRYLDQCGIFHGDLSPGNILVDINGMVKLLDFGLANTGGAETRVTPEFAAPERLKGARPDLLSDLFSLDRIEAYLTSDQPAEGGLLSAREQLARRVAALLAERMWARHLITHPIQATPKFRLRPKVLCATLSLFLSSSTALSTGPMHKPVALLSVRTLAWHSLSLDGQPIGYAPLTVVLPTDRTVVIDWTSAHGHGRKALRAGPGQRMLMVDRDFARE